MTHASECLTQSACGLYVVKQRCTFCFGCASDNDFEDAGVNMDGSVNDGVVGFVAEK